ncbi:MAG: hypothetical protein RLZZ28_2044 [Bacteroidota bacterium]|jgi:ribosomal protein S18 acetylase RimI-like enzyme
MQMLPGIPDKISITKTVEQAELAWCANLMIANEPWITLQRGYDASLQLLQDSLSEVFILKQENEPIGFMMLKLKGSFTGYIQTIVIKESMRGHGLGEAAIKYAETLIFSDSPNVFICASSFNRGAQKLYKKLGYEVVGILKDYVQKGCDEVFMRKTIASWNDFKK